MRKRKVLIGVMLMCFTLSLKVNAEGASSHLYNPEDDTISGHTISGHNSTKSQTSGDNYTGNGGAVMYNGETGKKHTIEGSIFTNNHANLSSGSAQGGAIYSSSELTINNTTFDNNFVKTQDSNNKHAYGGAIIAGTNLTINNSNFSNNYAEVTTGNNAYGGAIFSYADDFITNTNFTSNHADVGGAIFSNKGLNLTGGSFTGNNAQYYGGAIYANGGSVDIDGTKFTDNKTTTSTNTGRGGAIHAGQSTTLDIKNAEFTGNSAGNAGGIFADDKSTLTITDTSFNNNSATGNTSSSYGNGGAIITSGDTTIKGSSFNGNTAHNFGGAVFQNKGTNGKLTVENSSFTSNKAAAAGAIVTSAETSIKDSNFNSNAATNGLGGAIFNNTTDGAEVAAENTNFSNNTALRGGAIYGAAGSSTSVSGGKFSGNTATGRVDKSGNPLYGQGGAIFTDRNSNTLEVDGAVFDGNTAENEGGAIWSGHTTVVENSVFKNNKTTGTNLSDTPDFQKDSEGGGAIFVGSNSDTVIDNSQFIGNSSATVGGAIATRSNADPDGENSSLQVHESNFSGNSAAKNGGAIASYVDADITDTSFTGNRAGDKGGAIWANNNLNVTAKSNDIVFSGNSAADGADIFMDNLEINGQEKEIGKLTFTSEADRNITIADGISGAEQYDVTKKGSGTLTFNGEIKNAKMTVETGTLHLDSGSSLNNSKVTMNNGSTLDTTSGSLEAFNADSESEIDWQGDANIKVDISSATGNTDTFGEKLKGKNVTLTDFNPIGDSLVSRGSITKDELAERLGVESGKLTINENSHDVMSPLRKLLVQSTAENISFAPTGNSYHDFNPAVMAAPVAAQIGGYLNQLNSYDEAFRNMDMYMLMTKSQRQAMKNRNKYAAADSNLVFDPTSTPYDNTSAWFRPYATFENVKLKGGPKVSNVAWGSFFGAESELMDLGHGWDGMFGAYLGYNGSHQAYDGVGIYQNGATLGLVGMAYKDNYFAGLTANVGSNIANADSIYGSDDFTLLMSGIAAKTGYNWELADGKFIIQPSYMMSYSFVNAFDYTNAAGIRVNGDPLNAITFEPGVKFIGNLNKGWQPYAGVSVVWNVMDKTQFQASDATLPELSVKPFVKYGVGIRKTWGERLVGFFQTFFTSGGRNGVGLQAGVRITLGKAEPKHANSTGEKKYIAKN